MTSIQSIIPVQTTSSRVPLMLQTMVLSCLLLASSAWANDPDRMLKHGTNDITLNETLSDANAMPFDFYGGAVSVYGDWAMVGAESNSDAENSAGAVFVYQYVNEAWTETDEINADVPGNFQLFGGAVSLWGNTAMIGARGDDSLKGAVYVFERSGSQWLQVDKLVASDAASGDQFGQAISLNGNRLLVGSPRDDDNAFNSGTTYVFEYDGNNWVEMGKLLPDGNVFEEFFGSSVSLQGDRALVGAYNGVNLSSTRTGTAYVFEYDGMNWNQTGKLLASDGAANDLFGFAVGISGDHALVGAHGDDINTGAVYAYAFNGATWGNEVKLNSADAETEDAFGISLTVNGNRALIGAYRADNLSDVDTGAAYVFEFDGQNWNEMLKLFNNSAVNNNFMGRSVALTNSWLVIGADGFNGNRGEVNVYLDDPVYLDGFDVAQGAKID